MPSPTSTRAAAADAERRRQVQQLADLTAWAATAYDRAPWHVRAKIDLKADAAVIVMRHRERAARGLPR
jgi:hypothetical protein